MQEEGIKYERLPGTGYRETINLVLQVVLFFFFWFLALLMRGRKVTLWLGPDHLLVVDSLGYKEEYKRFYYSDIQGVVIRPSVTGDVWNVVWGCLAVLFVILGFSVDNPASSYAWWFWCFVFVVCVTVNIARGKTCDTELFTAVQSEKLVSLGRVRRAHKVLQRLRPLIEQAQGELQAEDLLAGPQTPVPAESAPMNVARNLPIPIVSYPGKMHLILSVVAVTDVIFTLIAENSSHELVKVMTMGYILTLAVLSFIALNKQKGTDLPKGLRLLPFIFLGQLVLSFVASVAIGLYSTIATAGFHGEENKLPAQVALTVISTTIKAFGGLYGIAAWRRYKSMQTGGSDMDLPPELPID